MSDSLSMSVLVVVGTRVVVRGLAGEEVVGGHEHRVRHGDDSLLMAAMPHNAPIPSREGALRRSGAGGQLGLMSAPRSHRLPLRVFPDLCFPALSLLPGHRPAQLARCAAVGNTPISTPISAMSTSAVRLFTPGIVSRRLTSSAKGAMTSAMCVLSVSITSSR